MSESQNIDRAQYLKVNRLQRLCLGYQPLRMKPVHFATSFLLALCRNYRKLELLNKAANPKAAEKTTGDEYVAENLFETISNGVDAILAPTVNIEEFKVLRQHLNAVYNNDGAAMGPAFAPYSTFGCDYSTPSLKYLSNKSKNHGNAGAFIWLVLNMSESGKNFLSLAKNIVLNAMGPADMLGRPVIEDDPEEDDRDLSELCGSPSDEYLNSVSKLMKFQTEALELLSIHLQNNKTASAVRNLIIGIGSWLLTYQIRKSNSGRAIFFCDFAGDKYPRLRAQSAACYSRQLSVFGKSLSTWLEKKHKGVSIEDIEAFNNLKLKTTKDLEDHFRDFSVRIGWVQPRTGTHFKYFRPQPDTMRVLMMSVLEPDKIYTMNEVAERLKKTWNLVLGLLPGDHSTLLQHGYSPLDEDSDLRANKEAFRDLAIHLGLAWEPSDGLVLFSLNPDHLM